MQTCSLQACFASQNFTTLGLPSGGHPDVFMQAAGTLEALLGKIDLMHHQ